ncbi:MAG: HesB/IscA family protein [Gammaproteobacteria bacterium]
MFKITPSAATQITKNDTDNLPLRVAAKYEEDGSIHYGMGFDDRGLDEDITIKSEGISIVMEASSVPILNDTTLDFVKLEGDEENFIFINPKDPNYKAPTE